MSINILSWMDRNCRFDDSCGKRLSITTRYVEDKKMTFIEAAAYVLEQEGRPLHSREIAEKAVDLGLLSHVGKTPVQTMSARLSAAVAKGRGKGPFVRIRRGVFGLSSWQGRPPGPAKREAAPSPEVPTKQERRERPDSRSSVDVQPSTDPSGQKKRNEKNIGGTHTGNNNHKCGNGDQHLSWRGLPM